MTIKQLTAEQQRRESERRAFSDIDRRLTAESKARTARGNRQDLKQRAITAIGQLNYKNRALFVNREAKRIDQAIKTEAKARIPTLKDIAIAGYKYGISHPTSARLIYNNLDAKAKIIRKVVPERAGIPASKAMFAFSDGAIKGIRNDPIKTVAFFALPGVVGAVGKGARYVPLISKVVKSEKAMKAAAVAFDVAYSHNVYTRVNAPVLGSYKDGKTTESRKTLPDGSIQVTSRTEQIPVMRKPTASEQAERLGYIFSTEAGPMVFGAMGIKKVSRARFTELTKPATATAKQTVRTIKSSAIRVSSGTQTKITASQKRYDALIKEKFPTKSVRLFKQIRTNEGKLIFENNPVKRRAIESKLKSLHSQIQKELSKSESVINTKLKYKRADLLNATNRSKIKTLKQEISALEKQLESVNSSKMQRILKSYRKFLADESGTLAPQRAPTTTRRAVTVDTVTTRDYIAPLTSQLNKLQVSANIKLDVKPKTVSKLSSVSDLPDGKINVGTIESQLNAKSNMPAPLKKQVGSIKTDVQKLNQLTSEIKTNVVKLNKMKNGAKNLTGKPKKVASNRIHKLGDVIKDQFKNREKIITRIIGKINNYKSSDAYRKYVRSLKPKDTTQPKTKPKVKPKVKPKSKTVTKPKTKTKTRPKTKAAPKLRPTPKIPKVIFLKPTKKNGKKKKKKTTKKGAKESFVKNPVPSLREFIG